MLVDMVLYCKQIKKNDTQCLIFVPSRGIDVGDLESDDGEASKDDETEVGFPEGETAFDFDMESSWDTKGLGEEQETLDGEELAAPVAAC